MKNWNRGLLVVLICVMGAPCPARAAEVKSTPTVLAPTPVSLDGLVREVVEHHPELGYYQGEIAAAKGERRTAGAWSNPEFSASAGEKRVTSGGLADEGHAWSVSLKQTFEWPGRIPLRKAIANRQVQLAELGLAQFRSALAARTRLLAFNLFAAQEKSAAIRKVADRFQELREVLVQREPAGLTPMLEARIIEATELTLQRRAGEAALAMQSALLELNQLRGAPWTNPLALVPPALSLPASPELQALLAAASTNNFELQMRRVELEQQGLKVSLARKERGPAFSVGPYYSEERAGDRERQVGLSLSVPLPLWNRNKGSLETAAARQLQAESALAAAERELERHVVEASLTYQAKREEMARWRTDSIHEFAQAAELADRHYRLGAVPVATYVELQKQYLEAVEALLDTRREALEAAGEMQRLTGLELGLTLTAEAANKEAK